jgi:peptide methionine sulfoxide reductase msrA/msrB
MKTSLSTGAVVMAMICRGPLSGPPPTHEQIAKADTVTLAGGCFWCMEPPFEKLDGVYSVVSGYTGGTVDNPTYAQVSSGTTGHFEAVRVLFDSSKVSYRRILEVFWRSIDPADPGGQFADRGDQYKTAIFYHNEEQKKAAEQSRKALEESGKFDSKIVTSILPASVFWPAEEYHQDYCRKNPERYERYKEGSGRGPFLEELWKE